jgi:thiol:disulfide interchange protein DsbD
MKRMFVALVLSSIAATCFSQGSADPVSWTFSAKKIDATTYEIHLTATIEDGWHIYSQTTPDGGPVPTAIKYNKNPLLTMDGATKEVGKLEQRHEKLFGVDVKQFSDKIDFVQTVKLKASAKTNVSGTVEFMTCNDEMCMPPKSMQFSVSLK